MAGQSKDHPQPSIGNGAEILDYARPGTWKGRRRIPVSGIVSLVAIFLQIPWGCFAIIRFWGTPLPTSTPPAILVVGFVFWPTLVSLLCGCHSLWVAGISWRNTCGVLGLIVVAAEFIWVLWKAPPSPAAMPDVITAILLIGIAVVAVILFGRNKLGGRNR